MGGFLWKGFDENHKKVLSQEHNENPSENLHEILYF